MEERNLLDSLYSPKEQKIRTRIIAVIDELESIATELGDEDVDLLPFSPTYMTVIGKEVSRVAQRLIFPRGDNPESAPPTS